MATEQTTQELWGSRWTADLLNGLPPDEISAGGSAGTPFVLYPRRQLSPPQVYDVPHLQRRWPIWEVTAVHALVEKLRGEWR